MSTLFFIKFNKKELNYYELNKLANEIVSDALKNNYAVAFNDEYLDVSFNEEKDTTILLSDSFLYRHGDELLDVTELVYESEENFKLKFIKKFKFLTRLIDIIFQTKIRDVDICINDINETCSSIITSKDSLLDDLLKAFTASTQETGFIFPNLNIRVVKNL